jgi:dCMP deaminase
MFVGLKKEYIMNWDDYFIEMAELVSKKSKDPSTKVGCVIVGQDNGVLSTGFNGFPRGVIETENHWEAIFRRHAGTSNAPLNKIIVDQHKKFDRWNRPQKYSWVEHAERNAVYYAARHGITLMGAKAYLNWIPTPCADCARAFIQAGIIEVIGPDRPFTGAGAGINYHLDFTKVMFAESGVKTRVYNYKSL